MELFDSSISCGLYELNGVGESPSECAYREAMRNCRAAIVIASVPYSWTNAIAFLKKKGFKQPLSKSRNPNSNNDIVILVRNFTKSQRDNLKKARCICRCRWCEKTESKCRCVYSECQNGCFAR